MKIDVASCIADLLYDRQSVVIPEFGSLVTSYRSASLDRVMGEMKPPGKQLQFDGNLVVNDGALLRKVQDKYHIPYEEARRVVAEYVQQIRTALEAQQAVVIPRVGKFYRNASKQIELVPESTNFEAGSYGLPAVKFYPTATPRPAAPTDAPPVTTTAPAAVTSSSERNWMDDLGDFFMKAWPYLAVLVALLLVFSLFTFGGSDDEVPMTNDDPVVVTDPPAQTDSELRLNQRPGENAPTGASDVETTAPEVTDTEGITPQPGLKEGVVIVGGFGNRKNVERLVKRIYETGYDAFTDRKGKITRVGIMFGYTDDQKIEEVLAFARREFEENSWVLYPEGYDDED